MSRHRKTTLFIGALAWTASLVTACGGSGGSGNPAAPSTTRIIALSGNLAFGSVEVGRTATATLTVSNSGNATLSVSSIAVPAGFTASPTSGTITAGGSLAVTVRFAPTTAGSYGGTITVVADQTSGSNTMPVSGTGTPPSNNPPAITGMTITPSFGIAQLQVFTMTATATDPNNDPLTYLWEFGDGTQGTGATVTKTYSSGGTMNVRLTVNDGRGILGDVRGVTDSRTASLPVGSMTGRWRLTLDTGCGAGAATSGTTLTVQLTQTSGTVEGTFSAPNGFCNAAVGSTGRTDPAEPGRIQANGRVEIRFKVGVFLDFYFRGDMRSPGTVISGGLFNSGFNGNAATMQKM